MKNIFSVIAIVYIVRLFVLSSRGKEKGAHLAKGVASRTQDLEPPKKEVRPSQIFETRHSFALSFVLMAGSFAVGVFIFKMVSKGAGLVYFTYWLPCCAAIFFGLGTAYRSGLLPEDCALVKSILKLSDKSLFECSGVILYAALALNIYVGPCSRPGIDYFAVFTAIPAALMYVWRAVLLYRKGSRDFWRLPGFVVILFLSVLVLVFVVLEVMQTDPSRIFRNECVAYQ